MNTRCSWCQVEQNIAPQPGESHGICARHRAAVLAEYGVNDAIEVARTFKDLRPVRNEDLEGDRLRARRIQEQLARTPLTDRLWVGLGAFLAGLIVLAFGLLAMAF